MRLKSRKCFPNISVLPMEWASERVRWITRDLGSHCWGGTKQKAPVILWTQGFRKRSDDGTKSEKALNTESDWGKKPLKFVLPLNEEVLVEALGNSVAEGPVHQGTPTAAAAAKPLQSCPTLCDPIDGSPLGSSVPGILQARVLEWVAIDFSNAWKGKVKVKSLSRARLLATPWTAAYQAPPSIGFSKQEYWSGVPLPSRHLY